jgi:hypothetical protein
VRCLRQYSLHIPTCALDSRHLPPAPLAAAKTGPSHSPCLSHSYTPPLSGGSSGGAAAGAVSTPPIAQQGQLPLAAPAPDSVAWPPPLDPAMLKAGQAGPVLMLPCMPLPPAISTVSGKTSLAAASKRAAADSQRKATNRQAQKRYRERQKARLLDMQVALDSLRRRLEALHGMQSRNRELEVRGLGAAVLFGFGAGTGDLCPSCPPRRRAAAQQASCLPPCWFQSQPPTEPLRHCMRLWPPPFAAGRALQAAGAAGPRGEPGRVAAMAAAAGRAGAGAAALLVRRAAA